MAQNKPLNHPPPGRSFYFIGFGISLFIATVVSVFASGQPDGLERVAEDLDFAQRGNGDLTMPGSDFLADYKLKGVPAPLATPLAGALGAIAVFGITWGLGKGLGRNNLS